MKRFEIVTRLAAPPERVFEASLDVETHLGSMADSGEHVVGGVTAGQLKLGDSVTWRATHFGIQWRMRVLITVCEPPNFFVDEQVHGPFKRWYHAHHFENDGGGGRPSSCPQLLIEFPSARPAALQRKPSGEARSR